jgi:NADH dehydrogenase
LSGGLLTKGWDRQVEKTGDEAKALKKNINENRIYPPAGSAENILAHSHIDAQWADSRE